jgi:U3 small nucleolar RNA-associated protein 21
LPTVYRSCIHQFPANQLSTSSAPNAITALVQSTAIDVVGIGFTSGEISVYDIRADERLMRMFMEGGGIKALGFRAGKSSSLYKLDLQIF